MEKTTGDQSGKEKLPEVVLNTTVVEQHGVYNGVPFTRRTTETVPVPVANSSSMLVPVATTEVQTSQPSTWLAAVPGSGTISTVGSGISNVFSKLNPFSSSQTTMERWKVQITSQYLNEKKEIVEDSLELEFSSNQSAQRFVGKWLDGNSNISNCTIKMYKENCANSVPAPLTADAQKSLSYATEVDDFHID